LTRWSPGSPEGGYTCGAPSITRRILDMLVQRPARQAGGTPADAHPQCHPPRCRRQDLTG
jgi:hypothetical protein